MDKPTPRSELSPNKRDYEQVWVRVGQRDPLNDAARRAGFRSVGDYIWHLHVEEIKRREGL